MKKKKATISHRTGKIWYIHKWNIKWWNEWIAALCSDVDESPRCEINPEKPGRRHTSCMSPIIQIIKTSRTHWCHWIQGNGYPWEAGESVTRGRSHERTLGCWVMMVIHVCLHTVCDNASNSILMTGVFFCLLKYNF